MNFHPFILYILSVVELNSNYSSPFFPILYEFDENPHLSVFSFRLSILVIEKLIALSQMALVLNKTFAYHRLSNLNIFGTFRGTQQCIDLIHTNKKLFRLKIEVLEETIQTLIVFVQWLKVFSITKNSISQIFQSLSLFIFICYIWVCYLLVNLRIDSIALDHRILRLRISVEKVQFRVLIVMTKVLKIFSGHQWLLLEGRFTLIIPNMLLKLIR